jgi:hypothetical protein
MGPNIRYLHGAYWDFWDHCLPLSDTSLREVLQLSGFEIEQYWPRFLPYQMSRRRPPPLLFLRVYLWVPIVWPVFGKQFLIFANKPAG